MIKRPQAPKASDVVEVFKQLRLAITKGQRRYLVASIMVHLFVVIAMVWSWDSTEAVKIYSVPPSVQARVLTAQEIDSLPYKKRQQEQQALKKKKEALRKKKEAQRKKDLARKKAAEEKQRKQKIADKAAKKAAEKKRLQEKNKAIAKPEKREPPKQVKPVPNKQTAAPSKEELKRAKRLDDLAKQRQQTIREQRMAERLSALQDLKIDPIDAPVSYDLSERDRYNAIIRSRIESRWFKPPGAEGRVVILQIKLLPTGELSSVAVRSSSGSDALDQSALAAVRAVQKFEVPKESAFFEEYFRSFQMSFKP